MIAKGNASLILLIAGASLLALLGALSSQYIWGLKPCELCQFQRGPHALVLFIGLLTALGYSKKDVPNGTARLVLFLFGIIFIISAALAFYHFGVEKGVFKGFTACTSEGPAVDTAEEMLNKINGAPVVSCSQAQFELFGISMAGYNGIYSLFLMGLSFYFFAKINAWKK